MGTDAEIFQFDYESYVTAVVPAFFDLLENGRVVDWLQPFLMRRELRPSLWHRTDLARFLPLVRSDLSWVGPYDLKWTYDDDWRQRCSYSTESPEDVPAAETAEQINWLFKIAVSVKCLGSSQFVGRSRTVSQFAEILADMEVQQDDRITGLLAALGKRGFIIGYQFGSGFEGINGWLDPHETAELAKRLDLLRLPRYEVSFAAMEQFRNRNTGAYESPGVSFEELSLSFVRTTATIAAAEGCGLLWGNGVMPGQYYLARV
jgi:hypothetical protein